MAAVTVLIFGILLTALVGRTGPETQDRDLADLAARTVTALATAPGATFTGSLLATVPVDVAAGTEPFVAVIDVEGIPVFSTGQVAGSSPTLPRNLIDRARDEGSAVETIVHHPGVVLRVWVVPFSRPDLGLDGVVVAGQSTRIISDNLNALRAVLFIAGTVTVLASWLVARLVANRALEPLRELARTTGEIATTGDLGRRLPTTHTDDEVGVLTAGFNDMLDRLADNHRRLEESLDNQRRFVADASHELRNPLSIIRSNLSFLDRRPDADSSDQDEALLDSNRAAVRMSNLIDDLLRLARLDAGIDNPRSRVSIADAVREAASRARGPTEIGPTSNSLVEVNLEDLTRLLINLIDNAHLHGAPPVKLAITDDVGEVVVIIADSGPGLPEDHLEKVFDRFYRADPARSPKVSGGGGAGLGLSIARGLAERLGGSLTAANGSDGGAVFTLRLPSV